MLKPLQNRVVVRPDEQETETASGIILLEKENEKSKTGVVLVGNETVQEGQHVLFSPYGFDEITFEGEKLYVISDSCLLAIL